MAGLVKPGASVLEFGAGRLVLRIFLPEGCSYAPTDLVDRGSGTIVCDLNANTLPEFPPHDVAVFGGVLEYVDDVPRLILHLSRCVDVIIASYATMEWNEHRRREQGWVNDYSSDQLMNIFGNAGFQCDHSEKWETQKIYRLARS